MGLTAAQFSLAMALCSICLAAVSVFVSWREASRSTAARKWLRGQQLTKASEPRLAKLEADQAELFSTLQKLTTSMRRLSSRAGMQDLRERSAAEPPPLGTPKAQLREHYGLNGLKPADIARRQMSLVPQTTQE